MTIYKAFVRSHLDYGDVIYDEAYIETFHQKLESIQIRPAYPYRELLEDRQEKNFIKKLSGNFLYFTRFLKKINQFTFSI